MQILIIIIPTINLYQLIAYVLQLLKDKYSIINDSFTKHLF